MALASLGMASLGMEMARLIGLMPEAKLSTLCEVGGRAGTTLEFLASDYVDHIQHHLRSICSRPGGT